MAPNYSATVSDVKVAARGQWLRIFRDLFGLQIPNNTKEQGPCPKCGGVDRFRVIDLDNGVLFCNQCFNKQNGDGLAGACWWTGTPNSGRQFYAINQKIADFLGVKSTRTRRGKPEKQRIFFSSRALALYFLETLTKKHGSGVKYVRSWAYDNFWVLRFDLPTPAGEKQRKEFRPICRVPLGAGLGWTWSYPVGLRVLYGRQEVEQAPPGLLVVSAGEKATNAARALGLVATTCAGGEKSIDASDWSPAYRFTTVAIVVDNDPSGEAFGQLLAAKLRRVKPEIDCRIIRLPGLPPKGDIVEWIAGGGSRELFLEIVAGTERATALDVGPVAEANDDPYRLARVNLDRYSAENNGRTLRYWRDEWYRWKTNRVQRLSAGELRARIVQAVRLEFERIAQERQILAGDGKADGKAIEVQKISSGLVTNVIQSLSSMCCISSSVELGTWLPTKERKDWIAMENGILDVESLLAGRGEDALRPNSPEWFSMVALPYAYDSGAECPRWQKFLEYNLEMDPERIKILQEWAGYMLLPDTDEQKFLVLEGEGRNGKSVFLAGLTAMLGVDNVSNIPLEIFGDRFSRTDTIGKLMNAAGDVGDLDKAAEGYLKSFTSGDRMYFDRKGLPGLNCVPTARLLIACNNRPQFRDRSEGVFRRILLVPLRIKITKQQRIRGMDKVKFWQRSGELPGILNWAIQGLARLRAQGDFTESSMMNEAIEEYKSDTNPARSFLLSTCKAIDIGRVGCTDLYKAYTDWSRANGYQHPYGERTFGKEVRRTFPEVARIRVQETLQRVYYYDRLSIEPSF